MNMLYIALYSSSDFVDYSAQIKDKYSREKHSECVAIHRAIRLYSWHSYEFKVVLPHPPLLGTVTCIFIHVGCINIDGIKRSGL